MWRLAVRDLVWRRRRFLIAIVATSLVFAMTLLLAGVTSSVDGEPGRITRLFGADRWIVTAGTSGPFTTTKLVPEDIAGAVEAAEGVRSADAVLVGRAVTDSRGTKTDLNLVGIQPGRAPGPTLASGSQLSADGEAVVDVQLHVRVGDTIHVDDVPLRVVGRARGVSFNFGLATIIVTVHDAQHLAVNGAHFATAIVTHGVPTATPAGYEALDNDRVIDDLHRPIDKGLRTITFLSILLWVVAGGIVGLIVYLTALERTRDFAVLKATGAATRDLLESLVIEALVLSVASAVSAVLVARLLAPVFPIAVSLGIRPHVQLFALAVGVALVASALGMRRAVAVDPALAFGGS